MPGAIPALATHLPGPGHADPYTPHFRTPAWAIASGLQHTTLRMHWTGTAFHMLMHAHAARSTSHKHPHKQRQPGHVWCRFSKILVFSAMVYLMLRP